MSADPRTQTSVVNFTVILLGTGKSSSDKYYVLNQLCGIIRSPKYRVEGPNASGFNVGKKVEEAMKEIWYNAPKTLNLIGHSRGAIECIMIAGELKKMAGKEYTKRLPIDEQTWKSHKGWEAPDEINILAFDPVSRTEAWGEKELIGDNVTKFFCVAMQNESSRKFFGLQRLNLNHRNGQECYIPLPGTHGSAVQKLNKTNFPIGEVGLNIACRFLKQCKATLGVKGKANVSDRELLNKYCKINVNNPVITSSGGKIPERNIFDVTKKGGVPVQEPKSVKKGEAKTRVERINEQIGYTYRWDKFFINIHHAHLCEKFYPGLCALLLRAPKDRNTKKCEDEVTKVKEPFLKDLAEKNFKGNIEVSLPKNMQKTLVPKI